MKFVCRFFLVIFGLYALLIGGLSYVFHNVDYFHKEIESTLSSYLGQSVKIAEMETVWSGNHLGFYLGNIVVEDRLNPAVKYAQVEHVAARFKLSSIFLLWPKFSDITIEKPQLTLESFADGSFRFFGKRYRASTGQQRRSVLFISWLMNHQRADIHDGEFLWKHREGKETLIEKFSAQYRFENKERTFFAVSQNGENAIGLSGSVMGNALWSELWNADAKLLVGPNVSNLVDHGFKLKVNQGQGVISSEEFKVQRLADVVNIFGQGTQLQRWLSESKLSGKLYDINFDFKGSLRALKKWQFNAKGKKVSWQATEIAPGFNNLNAIFRVNQEEGVLAFSSQESKLTWPKNFLADIPVKRFSGEITMRHQANVWDLKFEHIDIESLGVIAKNTKARLTKTGKAAPFLVLKSEVDIGSINTLEQFFPKETDQQFRNWWKGAMHTKMSASGAVNFTGPLTSDDISSGKAGFKADFLAKNVDLDYGFERAWPKFQAQQVSMIFKNKDMFFSTASGLVGDVNAVKPRVKIVDIFKPSRQLVIDSAINGKLSSVVDFLQDGPLIIKSKEQNIQTIKINSVSGEFDSQLNVTIPLSQLRAAKVSGSGVVRNGGLMVGELFSINKINGQVTYTESTVQGVDILGQMFGGQTRVNVKTLKPGAPPKVRISADGFAYAEEMSQLISAPLASQFEGSSSWKGFIDIDSSGVSLSVESNLAGTAIKFPEPYAKKADEVRSLTASFQAGRDISSQLNISADQLEIQLESLPKQRNLTAKGVILAGDFSSQDLKSIRSPNNLPSEGIHIYSRGISADFDNWLDSIKSMAEIPSKQVSDVNFVDSLRLLDVKPESLEIFGNNLGRTGFKANSNNGRIWSVDIQGEHANGVGTLKPFEIIPSYNFVFDRLHWPSKKELAARGIVYPEGVLDEDVGEPNSYPDVSLRARNFRIFDRDFGSLSFKASANSTAWEFQEIVLESSGVVMRGHGEWFDDGSQHGMTKTSFEVASEVGGKMLNDLGFGDFLAGGEIQMVLDLLWRGAPSHFDFDRLNGEYFLDITRGSFPRVDADKGRLFGLLNLNALSRRLRLDFVDVFGKGLAFDQMKSGGLISEGNIILKDFFIFSPSVYIEALGKVGLAKENYDLQMLVSPQLGGNVALLTALSNPAAGAFVWLVDRIFKNQLNKVIVYTYDVTGPWEQPVVTRIIKKDDIDLLEQNN